MRTALATWLLMHPAWTQRRLARALGYSQSAISMIASGRRTMRADKLLACAQLTGLPPEALLPPRRLPEPPPPDFQHD